MLRRICHVHRFAGGLPALNRTGTIWEITIEVTSFKREDQLRSITFSLRLTGNPVLFTAVLTAEQLLFLLGAIARSMQTLADERTPLSAGGFFWGPPRAA